MPVTRRLAAVVMADVVGYSRLMERDEAGTHARLRELRETFIDPKIAAHGGRIVNTSGDGMLLEFPSATAALRCAVEVQREMGRRNAGLAAEDRLEFRIGINLGDVIIEGDDIAGDGVNVAARLESLAEPGGICVSSLVRDQAREDLGVSFVDSGEQQLKNIAKPVRVFNIALDHKEPRRLAAAANSKRFGQRWLAVAAVLVLAAVVVAIWRLQKQPETQKAADPVSWGTVLVTPFSAPPDDPALAAAVSQLTKDFTNSLGDTLRRGRVVPPERAAAIAAETADPQEMARKAGANWILRGELRPSDQQLAFTLRLLDARDAKQLDSRREELGRAEFANLEPMVRRLVSNARVIVANAQASNARPGPPTAEDLLNRYYKFNNPDAVVEAREKLRLLDEALKLDPNFAPALWARGDLRLSVYFDDFSDALGSDREKVVAEADADTLRAVTLDPLDPLAWVTRGGALAVHGNIEAARVAFDRAVTLDPTRFVPVAARVAVSLWAGDPKQVLADVARVRQTYGPNGPQLFGIACHAQLALGFPELAIKECERLAAARDDWIVYARLAAAYALQGDGAKAAEYKAKLLKKVPGFTVTRYEARGYYPTPAGIAMDRRYLIPGLRKAGVPE
jgi:class 3 adenylate cyclase/TolB-like protein